jgi:signal transduction histidine kinase
MGELESLQESLDALPDGVLVADAGGTVVTANDTAHRLLKQRQLVGRPLLEVMALQDLQGCDWADVAAPYTGFAFRTHLVEQAWRLSDGTELLVTVRLVRKGPHTPVEQVGVVVRSARARDRLDRERSDLVATIAHELRSPLTGVKGFTASMLANWQRFSDEQKKLIIESVHHDTDRLTRLIAELLDVARIDTGRLSLRPRPVEVGTAVRRVTDSVHAHSRQPILVDVPEDLPPLLADPDKFAQVMTNLVENAVRHGAGEVHVVARERVLDAGGAADVADAAGEDLRRVSVVVTDEGDGIAPEIRRRIFTKYWKHGATGGSGLGMYIVHGLVTAHGGTVTIGDAEGGGALIEVLWPVADQRTLS